MLSIRRSVRKYKPDSIPDNDIKSIELAIKLTPSAGNLRSFEHATITDKEIIKKLSNAAYQPFINEAPVVFVFFATEANVRKYGKRGYFLYSIQDATIACTHAHLAAANLGYGSCWIGAFESEEVLRILGKTQAYRPVAMLPVGVPVDKPNTP